MEYSKIIAVTGLPGLYELVASKNDGAIVRSLDDKSTRFVSSRVHNFSHLESIEIFTTRENVNLVDILLAMQGNSKALPDVKDNNAVKKYFEAVFPEMDFERVYSSDMKKMVKWFEVLKNNGVEIKLSEPPEEEAVVAEEIPEKPAKKETAEKPKKAAKKKEEPKKEEAPKKAAKTTTSKTTKAKSEDKKEEKPKKKTPAKKK